MIRHLFWFLMFSLLLVSSQTFASTRVIIENTTVIDAANPVKENMTIVLQGDEIKSIEFQSEIDKSGKRPSQADFKATSDLELFGFKKDEPLFLKKYMPHKLLGMVKAVRDANRIMLDGDKNKTQRELIEADWDNCPSFASDMLFHSGNI